MRKSRTIAAALTAIGLSVAGVAAAAPAHAGLTQCAANNVCSWHGEGYVPNTSFYQRSTLGNYPSTHDDVISSVYNRSGGVVIFWSGENYTGGSLRLGNGGTYVNLQGQSFNDRIESVIFE